MNLTWESAALREEEVTIGKAAYILREAPAGSATKHKDATFKAVKVNNETQTSTFGGVADADLVLLSECLFDKASGKAVPLATIRALPNRISEPLVEYLKEISGMQSKETKESLVKQRKAIDAKLAKLVTPEGDGDDTAKNSPAGATPS